jgi:hypothetical protein
LLDITALLELGTQAFRYTHAITPAKYVYVTNTIGFDLRDAVKVEKIITTHEILCKSSRT